MPGIVSWVIALREKGCLPRSRRLAYHSVGIAYGDAMCYTYGDCIDDSLTMSSELLAKANGAWIENITDQVEKCKKTADVAIYYLAGGVSDLIADGNPDFKKGEQRKLKEQFYSLIDHPFRKWLREIRPQDDGMAEAMKKWEKQVRSLARHLGEDYILSVSNNICRTREGKNGTLSLPKVLNIYYATLNKIYEKEEEGGKGIEKK